MNDNLSNPAPLGLLAFGMTTVLLNLHNAGFYPLDSMILAMGFAYGGIAQIVVGVLEFRKGNTFGTVAFTSYGLFWWTLVVLLLLPGTGLGVSGPTATAFAAYFFMWGIFTLVMSFGTLKANRVLQTVFISLTVLFFLLTARELTGNPLIGTLAGYEGIICGLSAVYLGLAEVVNEANGRTLLPIWHIG